MLTSSVHNLSMQTSAQSLDHMFILVCEVCRLTVGRVDCRCFLSFVFLGGARRLDLSPCNTCASASVLQLWCVRAVVRVRATLAGLLPGSSPVCLRERCDNFCL